MTLHVEPAKVREFGSWLDAMTAEAEAAISYSGHTGIDDGGWGNWMLKIIPAAEEIRSSSESMFRHLRDVMDASASEVFATARLYEDTDYDTAAALDSAGSR